MFQFGTAGNRTKPRIEVLRGFDPNEPTNLRVSAPVAAGVTIKSGQIVSLWYNTETSRLEWVLGVDTSGGGRNQPAYTQCYLAYNDSSDFDVQASGLLPALSCAGEFEVQTGYYKVGDTYNHEVLLTYDGLTGNVKATTLESGEPIIGICHLMRGLIDVAPINSNVTRDGDGKVLVVQFITRFLPNTGDAT